jgi:hypothetical protein
VCGWVRWGVGGLVMLNQQPLDRRTHRLPHGLLVTLLLVEGLIIVPGLQHINKTCTTTWNWMQQLTPGGLELQGLKATLLLVKGLV